MNMNRLQFIAFSLTVMSINCNPEPTPDPPVVTDQAMCGAACDRLNLLGCEEGKPIDMYVECAPTSGCGGGMECYDGGCYTTCAEFCVQTEDQGVWLQPGCVMNILSCDQLEQCAQ